MLIIKKWSAPALVLGLFLAVLTGCTPRGTRALLDGTEMIDEGRYEEAVQQLQTASALIGTNAIVWHQLGLAYQHAGRSTNAEQAYAKALSLDRNLAEAHFNLGMLRMEEQRFDAARNAFIAYTALRPNAVPGWLRLGTAQLRLREMPAAEKSFQEALRYDRQNADALNGLGVVATYRRDYRTALAQFNETLEVNPGFAAAALNLAVVNHVLNNRAAALERYREYLNLAGSSPESGAVRAIIAALDPAASAPVMPAHVTIPNAVTQAAVPPQVIRTAAPPVARTNIPTQVTRVAPPAERPIQNVRIAQEPAVRPAQDVSQPASRPPGEAARSTVTPPRTSAASVTNSPENRRGFLSQINPLRVFRGDPTNRARGNTTPLPPAEAAAEPVPQAPTFPRYRYTNPARGAAGDTAGAQRVFAEAVRAHQAGQLSAAVDSYREATRLDPGYFEAFYNLGSALAASGNVSQALTAYESALAIRPDSLDARFNFAVTLRQANYIADAIRELDKLLGRYPREARAHVLLGNIYAQSLRQNAKAREHYSKALELDPRHPQGASIRLWLTTH